jgi:predicted glycosyltransferase
MTSFFVPYQNKKPKAVSINGHRLIILARDREAVEEHLLEFGADSVRKVRGGKNAEEEEFLLSKLARTSNAGVVVAPHQVELKEVIRNLEATLPWLQ